MRALLFAALALQGLLAVPSAAQQPAPTAADTALVEAVIETGRQAEAAGTRMGFATAVVGLPPEWLDPADLSDAVRATYLERFDRALFTEALEGMQAPAYRQALDSQIRLARGPFVQEPDSMPGPERQALVARYAEATRSLERAVELVRALFGIMLVASEDARAELEEQAALSGQTTDELIDGFMGQLRGEMQPLLVVTTLPLVDGLSDEALEGLIAFQETEAARHVDDALDAAVVAYLGEALVAALADLEQE